MSEIINYSGMAIESNAIVNFLKQEVRLKEICQHIVSQTIIREATQERGITITDAEIQDEANRQRYVNRFESASATYAWLEEQLITPEDWEAGIRHRLLAEKLASHLFDPSIESYFVQHRLDYERVVLYHIMVPYEMLAQELFYQIEEGEISFYEAAHLYDIDPQRRLHCGYEDLIHRWALSPTLSAQIFGARPQEVIGPIQSEQGYDLYMAEEFLDAVLTPEVRREIRDRLFNDWLCRELLCHELEN